MDTRETVPSPCLPQGWGRVPLSHCGLRLLLQASAQHDSHPQPRPSVTLHPPSVPRASRSPPAARAGTARPCPLCLPAVTHSALRAGSLRGPTVEGGQRCEHEVTTHEVELRGEGGTGARHAAATCLCTRVRTRLCAHAGTHVHTRACRWGRWVGWPGTQGRWMRHSMKGLADTVSLPRPQPSVAWACRAARRGRCRPPPSTHGLLFPRGPGSPSPGPLPAGGGQRHGTGPPRPRDKRAFHAHVTASSPLGLTARQLLARGQRPPGAGGLRRPEGQWPTAGGRGHSSLVCHSHGQHLGPASACSVPLFPRPSAGVTASTRIEVTRGRLPHSQ